RAGDQEGDVGQRHRAGRIAQHLGLIEQQAIKKVGGPASNPEEKVPFSEDTVDYDARCQQQECRDRVGKAVDSGQSVDPTEYDEGCSHPGSESGIVYTTYVHQLRWFFTREVPRKELSYNALQFKDLMDGSGPDPDRR